MELVKRERPGPSKEEPPLESCNHEKKVKLQCGFSDISTFEFLKLEKEQHCNFEVPLDEQHLINGKDTSSYSILKLEPVSTTKGFPDESVREDDLAKPSSFDAEGTTGLPLSATHGCKADLINRTDIISCVTAQPPRFRNATSVQPEGDEATLHLPMEPCEHGEQPDYLSLLKTSMMNHDMNGIGSTSILSTDQDNLLAAFLLEEESGPLYPFEQHFESTLMAEMKEVASYAHHSPLISFEVGFPTSNFDDPDNMYSTNESIHSLLAPVGVERARSDDSTNTQVERSPLILGHDLHESPLTDTKGTVYCVDVHDGMKINLNGDLPARHKKNLIDTTDHRYYKTIRCMVSLLTAMSTELFLVFQERDGVDDDNEEASKKYKCELVSEMYNSFLNIFSAHRKRGRDVMTVISKFGGKDPKYTKYVPQGWEDFCKDSKRKNPTVMLYNSNFHHYVILVVPHLTKTMNEKVNQYLSRA